MDYMIQKKQPSYGNKTIHFLFILFTFLLLLFREHVLKSLDEMTKKFVQFVYERQGFSKEQAVKAGGKIFTYGSYRLGVNAKGKKKKKRRRTGKVKLD